MSQKNASSENVENYIEETIKYLLSLSGETICPELVISNRKSGYKWQISFDYYTNFVYIKNPNKLYLDAEHDFLEIQRIGVYMRDRVTSAIGVTIGAVYNLLCENGCQCDECSVKYVEGLLPFVAEEQKKINYIYVINVTQSTQYKIGVTKNINSRIANLQTGNGSTLIIEGVYPICNAYNVEAYIHSIIKDFRIEGEWFNLNKKQVNIIKQYLYKLSKTN